MTSYIALFSTILRHFRGMRLWYDSNGRGLSLRLHWQTKPQTGQSLIMAILGIALLLLAFMQFFWLGDITRQRIKLNTVSDSVAYSVALAQARSLNYLALLNRAYAAHHMASAHMHTLASWADFAATQAGQYQRANPPASLITGFFGLPYGRAYAHSNQVLSLGGKTLLQQQANNLAAQHAQFVNQLFPALQQRLVADFYAQGDAVAQAITRHSYDQQAAQLTWQLSYQPENAFTWFSAAQGGEWVQAMASQFEFLQPRNQQKQTTWAISPRCPHLRHQLRRRGHTQFDLKHGWASSDTQSFHAVRSNRWIGCYYREYAQGWAWVTSSAQQHADTGTVSEAPDNFAEQDFWRWVNEHTQWDFLSEAGNPLAASYARRHRQLLPSARAQILASLSASLQSLALRVSLHYHGTTPVLQSSAAAQLVFEQPNNRIQQASLFNPYWHVRLAPSDASVLERWRLW